jgi:hypothetical protein
MENKKSGEYLKKCKKIDLIDHPGKGWIGEALGHNLKKKQANKPSWARRKCIIYPPWC